MTLSAVTTTGIYCRPGCSASPRPENVIPYGNAAAAEANGYRACLRCRPYRAPDADGWLDGPELVCRAINLIVQGALDDGLEGPFAARLGVSARHLRRLFAEHVGATPDQLARSRRAHFARRLLDDSDLTVTDVAFAAGFGSVRQLNRSMHQVFRASPTELRARRRRADRLIADGGLDTRLAFRPPLDWERLLSFLGPRSVPGVEAIEGDTYRRTITVDGHVGVLEVTPGETDHLMARFHLPAWEGLIHHVARVRRLFGLDHDPAATTAHLGDDPVLSPWPHGLRVPGCWDPFEMGVRAILGQQVSVAGATTTAGRIVETYGRRVPGLGAMGLCAAFPTPDVLAEAHLALPAQRAEAIRSFSRACADGKVVLDGSVPLDDLVGALCELPGVGPWTAHYIALRLGERDAFPASDLGVLRALELRASRQAVELAQRWRPWRAFATMRLWSS